MREPARNSKRARANCLREYLRTDGPRPYMTCHLCKGPIYPAIEDWDADHIKLWANRPKDVTPEEWDKPPNVQPAHRRCHGEKSKGDNRQKKKGNRQAEKHFRVQTKPKRGFAGWRKFDGTIVWARKK